MTFGWLFELCVIIAWLVTVGVAIAVGVLWSLRDILGIGIGLSRLWGGLLIFGGIALLLLGLAALSGDLDSDHPDGCYHIVSRASGKSIVREYLPIDCPLT